MKTCINCNKEFEQKTNRGLEQRYCSTNCRMKSYNERKEAKNNEEIDRLRQQAASGLGLQDANHLQARFNASNEVNRALPYNFSGNPIEQLEKTYEAKTEAIKWEMKFNQVNKEVEDLRTKNNVLEMQLETMDDDGEDDGGGLIGTIVKNPQPVIMIINYIFDKALEFKKLKEISKTQPPKKTA